jgi:hypothetical protein
MALMIDIDQLTQLCIFLEEQPRRFASIALLRQCFPDLEFYELTSKQRKQLVQNHKAILLLWFSDRNTRTHSTCQGWQLAKDWHATLVRIAHEMPKKGDLVLSSGEQPCSGDMVLGGRNLCHSLEN